MSINQYHKTVERIRTLLDKSHCPYKIFEHEPVRTSEEAANIRPEYTIEQGEKVWETFARGCLLFCIK